MALKAVRYTTGKAGSGRFASLQMQDKVQRVNQGCAVLLMACRDWVSAYLQLVWCAGKGLVDRHDDPTRVDQIHLQPAVGSTAANICMSKHRQARQGESKRSDQGASELQQSSQGGGLAQ